jgi:hypothetical protein
MRYSGSFLGLSAQQVIARIGTRMTVNLEVSQGLEIAL